MAPLPKSPRKRLTTYLREWREFRGKNQIDVAEAIGVKQSTLSRAETGKTPYDQDLLEKLALQYGCDPADLLTIDPLKPDPPRLVYDRLRHASKEDQEQVMRVIDAMLAKAGIGTFPATSRVEMRWLNKNIRLMHFYR